MRRATEAVGLAVVFTLAFAPVLPSCSTAKTALAATGQTLHVAADTFVETASLMDRALDSGAITPEQYRTWSAFGRRYQVAYPLAVQAWEIARTTEGNAEVQSATATIAALVSQLADYYVQASLAVARLTDGGVP
jgi:hypothetical protein